MCRFISVEWCVLSSSNRHPDFISVYVDASNKQVVNSACPHDNSRLRYWFLWKLEMGIAEPILLNVFYVLSEIFIVAPDPQKEKV